MAITWETSVLLLDAGIIPEGTVRHQRDGDGIADPTWDGAIVNHNPGVEPTEADAPSVSTRALAYAVSGRRSRFAMGAATTTPDLATGPTRHSSAASG